MRWGSEIADTLVQVSGVLESLPPDRWNEQSLCELWRVRDVAGHLVWRLGSSTAELLRSAAGAVLADPGRNPMSAIGDVSVAAASADPAELVRRMRRIAALKLGGNGRTGVSELAEAVVHGYDIANPLGIRMQLEPRVTEAVARSRLPLLPLSARIVVARRSLVAIDAGWSVGTGPAIEGSAEAIVLYLFGRKPRSGN